MKLSDLEYDLPEQNIAHEPAAERDAARLLEVPYDPQGGVQSLASRVVRDLPDLLEPSLIVLNDTRVIRARAFGTKPSGGRVELLLLERVDSSGGERWNAWVRGGQNLAPGSVISLMAPAGEVRCTLERRVDERTWEVAFGEPALPLFERIGEMPLPPYIRRSAERDDADRYQTVFNRAPGSVAAPTAGLHFTQALLEHLQKRHRVAYITLHVGPGTFQPLSNEQIARGELHSERYFVPQATADAVADARRDGRRVVAVGTTVMRTLESVALGNRTIGAGAGRTSLFIRPPYMFKVVDDLLTNFHLPGSSLLALVMAFAGAERIRATYAEAIRLGFRFYSYGDAMLLRGPSEVARR